MKTNIIKRGVITLFLLIIFLISPSVLAQEQVQVYSGFNRFTDNVRLLFSNGDSKVRLALEIRKKEVNSALENTKNGKTENATNNLKRAQKKLKVIQESVSLKTSEEVKISVEEIQKIIDEDNLPEKFREYKLEEEKTQLATELTLKTFEYCKELAKGGYEEMLKEEVCNPDTAQEGLEDELKELKNLQEKLFTDLMWNIRSCIDDPGTCSCDEVLDIGQKTKCQKMIAFAIKCEYKEDEISCGELKAMEPKQGDNFAESFIPSFLMNLFKEKQSMIDYNIQKSDGVPPECWNYNNKPECRQYDYLKEWHYRGENDEERPGKPKEKEPTMQESIPVCFNKDGTFLEEKCGEIIIVKNEKGLINYITKNQIDEIINNFENVSEEHKIDINGEKGGIMINEMKEEINNIKEEIGERTFAPGTQETGKVENDVKNNVIEENNGAKDGDDGLKPEIKIDVDSDSNNGDDGFTNEIKTDISGSSQNN
ncbi:MAG: hypothetical protein WC908_01660 [Candidatus Paceibacterota bacterium]